MKTKKNTLNPAAGGIILILAGGCSTVGPGTVGPTSGQTACCTTTPPAGCTNCGGSTTTGGGGSPLPAPNQPGVPWQIKKEADGRILIDFSAAPDMYHVIAWLGYPNEGTPKGYVNITEGGTLRMHANSGGQDVSCGWDGGSSRFVHCPALGSPERVAAIGSWGNFQSNTRVVYNGQTYNSWGAIQPGYGSIYAPLQAVKDQSAGPNGLANDANAFTVL